jgi:hypothetical protein
VGRAGQLILCLFVFVRDLTFPQACLANIFYYIGRKSPLQHRRQPSAACQASH